MRRCGAGRGCLLLVEVASGLAELGQGATSVQARVKARVVASPRGLVQEIGAAYRK